jgi:hypothetical protein
VRPVVECLLEVYLIAPSGSVNAKFLGLKDKTKLQFISSETGISFSDDPWRAVADYYPVV